MTAILFASFAFCVALWLCMWSLKDGDTFWALVASFFMGADAVCVLFLLLWLVS
jgi:hypothetical protein